MDEGAKFEASGNLEEALAFYVRGRNWGNAARLALSLDRNLEAATYCLQAGRPYDAAVCFQKCGKFKECLDALVHVPASSPRYRSACLHALRVSQLLGAPLEAISPFLMPFISSKPLSAGEADALNQIAGVFEKTDKIRLASSVYRSVLSAYPNDADAKAGLAALSAISGAAEPPVASKPHPSAPVKPAPKPSAGRPADRAARGAKLADLLRAQGKVTPGEIDRVLKAYPEVAGSDLLLGEALAAEGVLTHIDVVQTLAEHAGIPFLTDEALLANASPNAVEALTLEQAERWKVVPVGLVDRHLTVAMRDPRDIAYIDKLRFATGLNQINGVFATELGIRQAIRKVYYGEEVEEQWHGRVWDESTGSAPPAPFSDRHTRTRERQFDTQDLEKRLLAEASADAEEAAPEGAPPKPALHGTIEMQVLPTVGSTFAGRFRIEALIGEGGSATIFRAVDIELNEPIALKLFRPSTPEEAENLIARFKLELSLSRQLSHPNIIRLFDLGSHEGWRYLTMELLEGSDLATRLTALGKPMPFGEGLRYLEQICVGLQFAHEHGVVHRDIKPQNLFIAKDGVAKLMDFGIAKKLRTPGVTVAGMIVGTPEYMSPEQTTGFATVTHATDLYALGATAYMMFTGQPPFTHTELLKLLMAHATERPRPPSQHNPEIDPELDAAILKLLEKDPARRFPSARELGVTLQGIRTRLETKDVRAGA